MKYLVIAMAEDCLDSRVADGASQALKFDRKFREHGFERIAFTDGEKFFSREQMEAIADA